MFRVEQEMSLVARTSRSFSIREVKKALASALVTSHSSLTTLFPAEPLAKGIQDNSFLVEEAYNQEPGIIQHIINVPAFFASGSNEISFSFTQEWPIFTQTHQFSYTIPYTFIERENGFEDIRLNYRL